MTYYWLLALLCALGCAHAPSGNSVPSEENDPFVCEPGDKVYRGPGSDTMDPPRLMVSAAQPEARIQVSRETREEKPPYLAVQVGCVENDSLAPIQVDIELVWETVQGDSARVPVSVISPFPPNRATDQLARMAEPFAALSAAEHRTDIRRAWLVFTFSFINEEPTAPPVRLYIADLAWYTDEDF